MNYRQHYMEFQNRFRTLSNQEIINVFNGQVGINAWGTARAAFIYALHREINKREVDYSAIGDETTLSFKSKVNLMDNEILIASTNE